MNKQPFFILAPMDDVTDTVFRQIVLSCAKPDLMMTEFVNVEGLCSPGKPKLLPKLQYISAEQPLIAQIWGKQPQHYYQVAQELVELGFAGIDINMGCPEKNIVQNGCCSAFIKPENQNLALEIIQAVKEAVGGRVPVSVKTRLGFNQVDLSWHERLLKQGIDMLTVHGRTRKEMSKVPAKHELIGEVVKIRDRLGVTTKIVANGDIKNKQHGLELAEQYNFDGLMIGRGIFQDPFAFADDSPWPDMKPFDRYQLLLKHVNLFAETWQDNERRFETLKKFIKIYISDFASASELRSELMDTNNITELQLKISKHINKIGEYFD